MKLVGATACLLAMSSFGLAAQTAEVKTKTETKIEVKDGKSVRLGGCLERNANGDYVLTDVGSGPHTRYILVSEEDLSKNIGRRVEIRGTAAGDGNGKVKIEHKVKTSGYADRKTTTEGSDLGTLPFLGVKSVKTIADSCR